MQEIEPINSFTWPVTEIFYRWKEGLTFRVKQAHQSCSVRLRLEVDEVSTIWLTQVGGVHVSHCICVQLDTETAMHRVPLGSWTVFWKAQGRRTDCSGRLLPKVFLIMDKTFNMLQLKVSFLWSILKRQRTHETPTKPATYWHTN